MAELKKVKTAIVGCGMISSVYLKNLTGLFSIIDLAAVCDLNENNAKKQAEKYGVSCIMTLDEICISDKIELVINLTGSSAHYDVIKKLLLAGKNVFTEKVLCLDFEKGKELVSIAKEKDLYLGVAPDTFLGAGLQTARKILDDGLIGKPTSCIAAINRNQAFLSEMFGFMRQEGGQLPYDMGVYYLTALVSLLGPVEKVTGFGSPAPRYEGRLFWLGNYGEEWELPGNNLQAGVIKFRNGVLGNIHFDGTSINDEQLQLIIYGTEGILAMGDPNTFGGKVTLIRNGEGSVDIPFTHGYKGTPLYGETDMMADAYGHRGVGAAEMAWSMRLNRPHRASGDLGLHVLEILHGIDVSSQQEMVYHMITTVERPRPLPTGYISVEMGAVRSDAEISLMK